MAEAKKAKEDRKDKKATRDSLEGLNQTIGRAAMDIGTKDSEGNRTDWQGPIKPMKRGGRINKTGVFKLHAGEVVVPAHLVKRATRKTSRKSSRVSGRR
jgi:hypothetical protein